MGDEESLIVHLVPMLRWPRSVWGEVRGHDTEAHIGVGAVFKDTEDNGADADDLFGFVGVDVRNVSDAFHMWGEGNGGVDGWGHFWIFGLR